MDTTKTRPFIWFAEYEDGTVLTEFENNYKKQNKFNDIKKKNLKRFGFMSREARIFFLVDDGIINIIKTKIEFYIEDENGNIIKLSGRKGEKYNDIIQLKGFRNRIGLDGKDEGLVVNSYHLGYNHTSKLYDNKSIDFTAMFRMPMNNNMEVEITLTPNFQLKGKLFIDIDGNIDTNPSDINIEKNGTEMYNKNFSQYIKDQLLNKGYII